MASTAGPRDQTPDPSWSTSAGESAAQSATGATGAATAATSSTGTATSTASTTTATKTPANPTKAKDPQPPLRGHLRRWCLAVAVFGAVLLVVFVAFFVWTPFGQRADFQAQRSIQTHSWSFYPTWLVTWLIREQTLAVMAAVAALIGLARRRLDLAVGAVVTIVGANLTTHVLKYYLIVRPDYGFGTDNITPSGHTTAAVSVAMGLAMVAPVVARFWTLAILSLGTSWVALGLVVLGAHRPGDTLAAVAVCLVWSAIGMAAAGLVYGRPGRRNQGLGSDRLERGSVLERFPSLHETVLGNLGLTMSVLATASGSLMAFVLFVSGGVDVSLSWAGVGMTFCAALLLGLLALSIAITSRAAEKYLP